MRFREWRENAFFIETHCHLAHKRFNQCDRNEIWNRMQQVGVKAFIEIPIGYNTNYDMRRKLEGISQARYAVGVHPLRVERIEPKDPWMQFCKWLQLENSIAVGEIGLDFHVSERKNGWELQKEYIQLGFLLGIGGYVTYDLKDLLETVEQINKRNIMESL